MPDRFLSSKASWLGFLQVLAVILLAFVFWAFASDFAKGLLGCTVGALGLLLSVLLKAGRIQPGTKWIGNTTPLRLSLLSVGLLGFGIDSLLSDWEAGSGRDLDLPLLLEVLLLLMILSLFPWAVMEWRQYRRRDREGSQG